MIGYEVPVSGFVWLKVFDMLGREQANLVGAEQPAGYHQVTFNASSLPNGIYFYRLQIGSLPQTKKLVLLK